MPPSILANLLRKVERYTAKHGQSALAEQLGVDRQRVSDWLKGKSKPNGETALRISAWVAEIEDKPKKEPSGASTPKGRKTRTAKSKSNEKDQSDRK